jgi:hypothetical protein
MRSVVRLLREDLAGIQDPIQIHDPFEIAHDPKVRLTQRTR